MDYSSVVPQTAPKLRCLSCTLNPNNAAYDANNDDNANETLINSVDDLSVACHCCGSVDGLGVEVESQWYDSNEEGWYYNNEDYDYFSCCNYDCCGDECNCWYEEQWLQRYDARETFDDEGYDCDTECWYDAEEFFDYDGFDGDGFGCDSDRGDSDWDSDVVGGSSGDDWSDGGDGPSEGADSDRDGDSVEGEGGWNQDARVTGFKTSCFVYPLSHIGKSHLEIGNKIILPLSALEQLMKIGVDFPMLFKVENYDNGKASHCGVLEFSSDEGMAIMPEWMMKNLSVEKGSSISIESVKLDSATYVKLQPHNMEFLDSKNPKSVLENTFSLGYSCLTVGDTIVVMKEGKKLYVDVVDAKPSNAVCIIDTDVEVDFALPLDYKEPEKPVSKIEEPTKFVPFSGTARRLSDKGKRGEESSSVVNGEGHKKGVELSENKSNIVFGGGSSKSASSNGSTMPSSNEKTLKPFTGKMYRLIDS